MFDDLCPLIAAAAQWLTRAYPSTGGAFGQVMADVQARQAATVAAWLRYPTAMEVELLSLVGPGGSGQLDWLVASHPAQSVDDDPAWRGWVDEVVVSWAASLLTAPELAIAAVNALSECEHASQLPREFRRLTHPDSLDLQAAALLRHPDLLESVTRLHRAQLLVRLNTLSPTSPDHPRQDLGSPSS